MPAVSPGTATAPCAAVRAPVTPDGWFQGTAGRRCQAGPTRTSRGPFRHSRPRTRVCSAVGLVHAAKLPVGPGDPGSPCVGEHTIPTMVLLPPLAQGRTSGPSSSSARGPSALPSASLRPFSGAALMAGCIQLITR